MQGLREVTRLSYSPCLQVEIQTQPPHTLQEAVYPDAGKENSPGPMN